MVENNGIERHRQKALNEAIDAKCVELEAQIPQNVELLKRVRFLKTAVEISSFYSNKKRGMREKKDLPKVVYNPGIPESDTNFVKKCKMRPVLSFVEK